MAFDLPQFCPVCHSPGPSAFGMWDGLGDWRCDACQARGPAPALALMQAPGQ